MSNPLANKKYKIIINANNPTSRLEAFIGICKLHNLDPEKEVEKISKKVEVKSSTKGYFINLEHLILFFKERKLTGDFNFEEKTITLRNVEDFPATGVIVNKNPSAIGNTSVDNDPTPSSGIEFDMSDDEDEDEDDGPF